MSIPVAITGIGVLTPLGDSLDKLTQALAAGQSSVAPAPAEVAFASSRFADFDATRYANVRGMRIYNRTTRLGICATRLALADAGLLDPAALPSEQLGLIMASTYGHLDTLLEYDRSLVANGPSRTNPALMPLAIPSAPGAVIALSFAAKACSITLAGGGPSSLDALGWAARAVRAGRAQAVIVVGAASLFDELVLSLARAGQLAPPGAHRVLDSGACGTALGEGAAALVLESTSHAAARHREPKAFVTGQASTFAAAPDQQSGALVRAGRQALAEARITAADLGLIASGASGVPSVDAVEAHAVLGLVGGDGQAKVTAVKSALGETMDASGLLAAAAALASLGGAPAGPIVGLERPAIPGPRYLKRAEPLTAGHALIMATSQTGACSALVLSKEGQGR